jgi:transposase InsO family protein
MMTDYLALDGIFRSYPTIYSYMGELGLKSIVRRKKPGYTKGTAHKVFPDLLNQNFNVDAPNKVWLVDFTYLLRPGGTTMYNCTIMDLFKRNVVASLNGSRLNAQLAADTLSIAIKRNTPARGLILHSDQGSQLTSRAFVEFCAKNYVQQSMSRAGCPFDNAPMERFFNTFKNEFYNLYSFESVETLNEKTYDFIYVKYNYLRPHSYNNGLPPCVALRTA